LPTAVGEPIRGQAALTIALIVSAPRALATERDDAVADRVGGADLDDGDRRQHGPTVLGEPDA
jgi:hypothetical protein